MNQAQTQTPRDRAARHVPVRTCVGCRATAPQAELVRVAVVAGHAVADAARRAGGRGAWLHPRPECLAGAGKGGLARSLRRSVSRAEVEAIGRGAGIANPAAIGRRRADLTSTTGQGREDAVESLPVPGASSRTDSSNDRTSGRMHGARPRRVAD